MQVISIMQYLPRTADMHRELSDKTLRFSLFVELFLEVAELNATNFQPVAFTVTQFFLAFVVWYIYYYINRFLCKFFIRLHVRSIFFFEICSYISIFL